MQAEMEQLETDPVSGNEVPPGSLPEEVRDDVDAKLSDGEYVVPADVVRYFGLKFFEDLRSQAKGDLGEMDKEGRIGGEPVVEAEGASELSAEEMALLQEVMGEPGFNQGGMVQNPEFLPKQSQVSDFNPSKWETVGSSFSTSTTSGSNINLGSYYKTYVGPNGETQLILFTDGKPVTPIPEGFTPQDDAVNEQKEKIAQEEKTVKEDDANLGRDNQEKQEANSWVENNLEAIQEDPISFGMSQLDKDSGMLGQIAGAIGGGAVGGLVGAGIELESIASAKAAREYARANGIETEPLDLAITKAEEDLSPMGKILNTMGVGSGSNYAESLLEKTTGLSKSTTSSSPLDSAAKSRAEELAELFGGIEKGDGAAEEARTAKAQNTEGTVTTVGGTGEGNAGVSVRSGSAAPIEATTRPTARPTMAKGGLVKKRTKKTNKK